MSIIAYASGHTAAAQSLVAKINNAILFPLITLLMALALLLFFWGGFRFIASADNESERAVGKRHMLFAIIGLFIMISAYAILKVAAGTFGLTVPR